MPPARPSGRSAPQPRADANAGAAIALVLLIMTATPGLAEPGAEDDLPSAALPTPQPLGWGEDIETERSNDTIDTHHNSTADPPTGGPDCEILQTDPHDMMLGQIVNATHPGLVNVTNASPSNATTGTRSNTMNTSTSNTSASMPANSTTTHGPPTCLAEMAYAQAVNLTTWIAELYQAIRENATILLGSENTQTTSGGEEFDDHCGSGGNARVFDECPTIPVPGMDPPDGVCELISGEGSDTPMACLGVPDPSELLSGGIPGVCSALLSGFNACSAVPWDCIDSDRMIPVAPGSGASAQSTCGGGGGDLPDPEDLEWIGCYLSGECIQDPPCGVDCFQYVIDLLNSLSDTVETLFGSLEDHCEKTENCIPTIPCVETNCLGPIPCLDDPCLPSCDEGDCPDPCEGEACGDPCGEPCNDPCGDTCQDPCGEPCGDTCEEDCGGCEGDCTLIDHCEQGECQHNCALPAGLDPWMGEPSPLAVDGMPEAVCQAVGAPCEATSHPLICDGEITERDCDLPATSEASPMPGPVCDALEAPCNLSSYGILCDGTIEDPCEEETSDGNVCETIENLIEPCEDEACGQPCDIADAPKEVAIREMPTIICDTLDTLCTETNDCQPLEVCDEVELADHCDPAPDPCAEADCEPDPCEETSLIGLCTFAEDPCVPETRELCVTYTYGGQSKTLPLNAPWLVPSTTGAPSALVWFVGVPLLVPENPPDPDLSPAGIVGSLLVLPGHSVGSSDDPVPVSVTYEDATFGTQASPLGPSIVAIDARATMKPASDATGMLGAFSPVEVDPSRLSATARVLSTVEPGPSLHGSIGGLAFSIAHTGNAPTWEARIQIEKDTMIRDPATNTGTQLGTRITFDWNAPTTGDLLVSVSGTELDITRMPATVTGAQLLMSDEPGNRFWAIHWPGEQVMEEITGTVDGEEFFRAQQPPALFTASVRMRLDEAPPGATRTMLETLSTASGGWHAIDADIRGQRTSEPNERFDLAVRLGDVAVNLTDLNANLHASYAQPLNQPEDAVIPAFILDAGHPENVDEPVHGAVVSRAEITVGQTATVIAQDIVDAHVDTRQGANSADRDAHASHVTFGEQGLIEVTHYPSAVRTRLSAASQAVELSLALTQDTGELGTAHVDVRSTGDMDIHITEGLSTILQLTNVQTGTINLGACDGQVTMTFGDRGGISFTGDLDLDLGGQLDGLLEAADGCGGSGGGGGTASLPLIVIREPEEVNFGWDLSADTADFAWRLTPFGRLQIIHETFEVDVIPYASEGYDELQYDMNGFWKGVVCDEAGPEDTIRLNRHGDFVERCTWSLRFETLGTGTASGLSESIQGSV